MQQKVYIILVTFNGAEDMPLFLASLKKYTDAARIQLVVVDNNSQDATLEIIQREYSDAIIFKNEKNTGFTGGNNVGISCALSQGAEYIFLANQDLVFESGWLDPLIDSMEKNPTIGALQPLIVQYPDTTKVNTYGNAQHFLGFGYAFGNGEALADVVGDTDADWQRVAYCSFAAVMLRASVLRKTGLFDEAFFMYHEDSDLCWRMRLLGFHCGVTRRARVAHHYDFTRSITKFYYIERNRFFILLRNYQLKTLLLIMPLLLIWETGILLVSLVGFIFMKKTIGFKEKIKVYGYFFNPKHWRHVLLHRAAIQSSRIIPDAEIVTLFTAQISFQEIQNPLLDTVANPLTEFYWRLIRKWI